MNRRAVIKNLALLVGGSVLLPSCLHSDGTVYAQLKRINLGAGQQSTITDICDAIIPKTTTPGAIDINVHLFVLKMLDDCYSKKDQDKFIAGLGEFNAMVKNKYNSTFSDLSIKDRQDCLNTLEKSNKAMVAPPKGIKPVSEAQKSIEPPKKKPEIPPLLFCYQAIKQQTIFGYTNSQYFMTKQIVYELIPGRYNAHFPVENIHTA